MWFGSGCVLVYCVWKVGFIWGLRFWFWFGVWFVIFVWLVVFGIGVCFAGLFFFFFLCCVGFVFFVLVICWFSDLVSIFGCGLRCIETARTAELRIHHATPTTRRTPDNR